MLFIHFYFVPFGKKKSTVFVFKTVEWFVFVMGQVLFKLIPGHCSLVSLALCRTTRGAGRKNSPFSCCVWAALAHHTEIGNGQSQFIFFVTQGHVCRRTWWHWRRLKAPTWWCHFASWKQTDCRRQLGEKIIHCVGEHDCFNVGAWGGTCVVLFFLSLKCKL